MAETAEWMPERDEDTGRYTSDLSDEDVLDALRELDGGFTTGVADRLGCHRVTAFRRLSDLEDEGLIRARRGDNAVFWLVD